MTIHYARLSQFPKVFRSMTGLTVLEFDGVVDDLALTLCAGPRKSASAALTDNDLSGLAIPVTYRSSIKSYLPSFGSGCIRRTKC